MTKNILQKDQDKGIKEYHFENACKSQEDFELAIRAVKENERERILESVIEMVDETVNELRESGDVDARGIRDGIKSQLQALLDE